MFQCMSNAEHNSIQTLIQVGFDLNQAGLNHDLNTSKKA